MAARRRAAGQDRLSQAGGRPCHRRCAAAAGAGRAGHADRQAALDRDRKAHGRQQQHHGAGRNAPTGRRSVRRLLRSRHQPFLDSRLRSPDRRYRVWPRTDPADAPTCRRTWRCQGSGSGMMRNVLIAGLLLGAIASAEAQTTLRVGDQKGNSQAVMEAAGVLKDVSYKIEWKEFPAAAPLLEALSAGAIETGLVGDAPFTFAAAANVPVKAIAAIRQSREGLAILVPENSPIKSFADLRGKKIATGRGSIGHQLILAALEKNGWSSSDVQIAFLAPSDAKIAYTQGSVDAWSTWEPYVSQEEVLFRSRRIITSEGLTPGLSFQVARPDAIRDKRAELTDFIRRLTVARAWSLTNVNGYAETWGKLMNIPTTAVPQNW